ncbi:MAG TPA: CheR family methyltransferase [Polyangiaceae bacterium]|nr:CheR family methyltransferase [Polyangiaceae bacterium]
MIIETTLVQAMAAVAASRTGFREEAIALEVIERMVSSMLARGVSASELLHRVLARDPEIVPALERAVAVGETYFFRQPEHFHFVASEIVPARRGRLRAWCAGCSTGEEAYALAATLLIAAPELEIFVLGSDLLHDNIAVARSGRYHPRALRNRPPLYPIAQRMGDDALVIDERTRAVTRFEAHNLLEPIPAEWGSFDVVLCRNVLVYFTEEARAIALAHLMAALADDGVLLFSPLDLPSQPPSLVGFGGPDIQAYRRARARPRSEKKLIELIDQGPPLIARGGPHEDDTVELHLRALAELDAGELRKAAALLGELVTRAPGYLPGLVEQALLHMRRGERASAMALMREVRRRTSELDPDTTIAGPEPLPARFYAATARAFLDRQERA